MEDYAIIIGLKYYPGLGEPALAGPENDARNFEEWVLCPDGGKLSKDNVTTIISSDFVKPVNVSSLPLAAKPALLEVIGAFENLRTKSKERLNAGLGPKVGRRLYLFMSGHGIAPTPYGNKVTKESALLMSNADLTNIGAPHYHLPGAYTATWMCENDFFDEVFLFMDCCRDQTIVPSLNFFLPPKGNSNNSTWFYAFATKWSRRARERNINGTVQGIFTKTLLMGLKGAAADPDPDDPNMGIITGASLKSYLYQNMKTFIDPVFLDDPQIQEPDIEYFPKAMDGKDIIIKHVPLERFSMKFKVSQAIAGSIVILNGSFKQVEQIEMKPDKKDFPIDLPRGKYLATLVINQNVKNIVFDVKGTENVEQPGVIEIVV